MTNTQGEAWHPMLVARRSESREARPGFRALLPVLSGAALAAGLLMIVLAHGASTQDKAAVSSMLALKIDGAMAQWPDAVAGIKPFVAAGLLQEVSKRRKETAIHNVLTELAQKVDAENKAKELTTPNDKVVLTMYMESECPACRRFSTTIIKEILAAPGVGDIVDFRAVPWGWGRVIEAPTPQQAKQNPGAFNILNHTAQLLPILSRLGAMSAETPPLHFACQHGDGECQGNALEACLQDIAPNHQQFFPVMDCLESRTCAEGMEPPSCMGQPTEVIGGCMQEFGGVDLKALNGCYNSPRVQELMIMNDLETMKAKPDWVPWFQLDAKNLVDVPKTGGNDTALFREQFLMGKKICDLYVAKTGKPAPEGCKTFPQNDAQVGADPFGKFKETNFTSLIAKLAMEKQQQQHAGLKKASAARTVSTPALAHKPASIVDKLPYSGAITSKQKWREASAKTVLPAKVKSVVSFADRFFGHDKVHEAMKDKMLAAAMKPVTAVRVVDRSAQGFEAFERAFVKADRLTSKALNDGDKSKAKAVDAKSDVSARHWKPPSTDFLAH